MCVNNSSSAGTKPVLSWEDREIVADYSTALQKRPGVDIPFLVLTLFMLMIGVVMVLSASFASAYYSTGEPLRIFLRQLTFAVTGIGIMYAASRIPPKVYANWSSLLLIVSIGLLVLVLIIGKKVNGARRWIDLGITDFQPSEIVKLAVILSFARLICQFDKKMGTFKYGVLPFVSIVAVVVALLIVEPHVSASVIIIAIAAIMMFAGGTHIKWFFVAGVLVVVLGGLMLFSKLSVPPPSEDGQQVEQTESGEGSQFGYAGRRINAWLNPEADPQVSGFQILQSLYAVGSGGLFGQGLGQSRQKYSYLPEEHNDYIFAIICEELGFIGAMLILALFSMLVIRGFWLALHARDKFDSLIVTGITSLLAIQVFLNVAVVTNLVPSTGISLPFFSYGGTALWIQLAEMGIILAVSRDIPLTKAG